MSETPPGPYAPLKAAQDWLRAHIEEGAECPCCKQFAKVYKRSIYSTMTRDLIHLYRLVGKAEVHVPTTLNLRSVGDFTKLVYWGLIREIPGERADGSSRVGWWAITDEGEEFIHNRRRVQKYARVYDGRCLGLMGEPVSVIDCLGTKFDYDELMSR